MLILADRKMPDEAKQKLNESGRLIEIETCGITYEAVSGHPDIFFFKTGQKLIAAPNLPAAYTAILSENAIGLTMGRLNVGECYPHTAHYNAVVSENYFIHNTDITDPVVLSCAGNKKIIKVRQGYSRCNLIALKKDSFITSDRGIYKKLKQLDLSVIYISPEEVVLPGFRNGFLGGAAGVYEDKFYLAGSLKYLTEGERLFDFAGSLGYEVIELYDGPVFDAGSIIFLENSRG